MLVRIYRNKYNDRKFIEVHNDGHYHNAVRQFIYPLNLMGDKSLHRMKIDGLRMLLEDYTEVQKEYLINNVHIIKDAYSYCVVADSDRFGKQELLFQSPFRKECKIFIQNHTENEKIRIK